MSWGFELDQRQRKFFKVGDLDAASATISSSTECSTLGQNENDNNTIA